jgi:ribonucleoside-diphosphate reductase beta chain
MSDTDTKSSDTKSSDTKSSVDNIRNLLDEEPLFRKDTDRLAPFPLKYPKLWTHYKKAQSSFWTAEELDLTQDKSDWETNKHLTPQLKELVKAMLAFFSGADAIVNANLANDFCDKIDILEVKFFYGFQVAMENIHNEVYSLLIDNIIPTKEEQLKLKSASKTMKNVSKLYKWAQTWIQLTKETELLTNPVLIELTKTDPRKAEQLAEIWSFAKRLVAFACVEGIMFSAPFCVIFWLKELGVLPGLTFSNELISKDEGMHTMFACELFNMIINKPPIHQLQAIVLEAVEFEKEFIEGCIESTDSEGKLQQITGLKKDSMFSYIEFVADKLNGFLNLPKQWKTNNPYSFMNKISINGVTNFFEKKVAEYSLAGFEEDELDDGDAFCDDF